MEICCYGENKTLYSSLLTQRCIRYERYKQLKSEIESKEASLDKFSQGYTRFGLHRRKGGLEFREVCFK